MFIDVVKNGLIHYKPSTTHRLAFPATDINEEACIEIKYEVLTDRAVRLQLVRYNGSQQILSAWYQRYGRMKRSRFIHVPEGRSQFFLQGSTSTSTDNAIVLIYKIIIQPCRFFRKYHIVEYTYVST